MLLSGGESQILREGAVPFRSPDFVGRGTLFLTNFRLVFENHQRGFMTGGSVTTVLDAPLHDIRNATVGKVFRRPRYLLLETRSGGIRLDVVDPVKWAAAITGARGVLGHPHAPPPPVTHTIERQVVKVRCRHCGSLSEEVLGKCPHCGAPL